jgi:hypothetical protein
MYKTLNGVPKVIRDFYYEDTVKEATGNTVADPFTYTDQRGELQNSTRQVPSFADVTYIRQHEQPETKNLSDLERVINSTKPVDVINRFIEMLLIGEQWQWFNEYKNHLVNLEFITQFNSNLPVVDIDENQVDILAEKKDLPVEPIRPTLLTVEEFKAANKALFNSYNKRQGVKINGYQVSLNKDNSDGLVSIKAGYELAGAAIFPTNFIADNANGTVSIKLTSYDEFSDFALQFLAARNALFSE